MVGAGCEVPRDTPPPTSVPWFALRARSASRKRVGAKPELGDGLLSP